MQWRKPGPRIMSRGKAEPGPRSGRKHGPGWGKQLEAATSAQTPSVGS